MEGLAVANRTFKFIVLLFTTVLFATSVCYSTNPITKAKFQSYNYPNMYIRHANFDARIDENVTPEWIPVGVGSGSCQ